MNGNITKTSTTCGTERDSTLHRTAQQTHKDEMNKTLQETMQSNENIIIIDGYQHPRITYAQFATATALGFCLCTILERKFPDSVGLIHTFRLMEVGALDGDDIMVVELGDDNDFEDGGDASTSQDAPRRPVGTFDTESFVISGLLREFCAA